MKIIHKYVLREHLGPLVFALSALTSLMLLNYIAKQLGNLVGKGLAANVIFEFFLLAIPFTIAMTLPMAVLVSVLYAFSRLASENEITAMKANGISMRRVLVPVLAWSVFLSLLMIVFNDQVLPRANHRLRALQGDIARKKPSFALREQVINEVAPGRLFLRANHLDIETNWLWDVTIYDLSDQMRRRTIYADSGVMKFADNGSDLHLTLYDGFIQEVPKEDPARLQRLYYKVDQVRIKGVANAFERDSGDTYKSDREMSVCELQREVTRHEWDYLRAYDRYNDASAVFRKNPNAHVTLTQVDRAAQDPAARSRVRTLGRVYCDGLRYLERQGLSKVVQLVKGAGAAVGPSVAHAQQARDTTRAPQDSSRRPDSAQVRDTSRARKDSAAPATSPIGMVPRAQPPRGFRMMQGDSAAAFSAAQPPIVTDSATAGMALPIPPSAGVAPTIPATVEMDTQRAQMLAARAQMNQYSVEIHKKFAISAACVVFVLLGAPLALRFPRGGVGLVIGVSLIVFALYYVGLIAGEALADRNILRPSLAMWSANILFAVGGLVLLSRMELAGGAARGQDASERLSRVRRALRRLTGRRTGA